MNFRDEALLKEALYRGFINTQGWMLYAAIILPLAKFIVELFTNVQMYSWTLAFSPVVFIAISMIWVVVIVFKVTLDEGMGRKRNY